MLTQSIFGVLAITLTILAPVATAGRTSPKYDPYNSCGAPFCGSTGNVAAAGAVVRDDTANVANDQFDKESAKTE